VFDQVGWGEIALLVIVALFVFGPEKLPQVAQEAGRMIRGLRKMARDFSDDVKKELGPEFQDLDLEDLNPRTFVRKRLLSEFDDDDFRFDKYFDDLDEEPTETARPKISLEKAGQPLAPKFDADAT
jgi:sec-independent protein translocase protein TatB